MFRATQAWMLKRFSTLFLSSIDFRGGDEAVATANNTGFGLAAHVYTSELKRRMVAARCL
jgi:acyl-CoA reductase-like NAD-dependent aldehyde dehydrogenase